MKPYFCTYATVDVPPPIIPIRDNIRIDWFDHNNNAIGNYNQRLALTYIANSRLHIVPENLDISAHSLIISVASETLEILCYGDDGSRNADGTRIEVPDCTSSDFLLVLRYLYSCGAVAISKIAKRFGLHHLGQHCSVTLSKAVSPENACRLFSQLHPSDNAIAQKCLQLIVTHCEEMLQTNAPMDMSREALDTLFESLDRAGTRPNPVQVLQALIRWVDAGLVAIKRPLTGANRRQMLSEQRFRLIQFQHMTYLQFAKSLLDVGTDFLSDKEVGECFRKILLTNPFALREKIRVIGCSCGKRLVDGAAVMQYANGQCCFDAKTLQFMRQSRTQKNYLVYHIKMSLVFIIFIIINVFVHHPLVPFGYGVPLLTLFVLTSDVDVSADTISTSSMAFTFSPSLLFSALTDVGESPAPSAPADRSGSGSLVASSSPST